MCVYGISKKLFSIIEKYFFKLQLITKCMPFNLL